MPDVLESEQIPAVRRDRRSGVRFGGAASAATGGACLAFGTSGVSPPRSGTSRLCGSPERFDGTGQLGAQECKLALSRAQ